MVSCKINGRMKSCCPHNIYRRIKMETRIAVISIIAENTRSASLINDILHEYGDYIIGRMGLPYRQRNVNIISVALDAPQSIISAVSGKIGNLPGVEVKTAYSNK